MSELFSFVVGVVVTIIFVLCILYGNKIRKFILWLLWNTYWTHPLIEKYFGVIMVRGKKYKDTYGFTTRKEFYGKK